MRTDPRTEVRQDEYDRALELWPPNLLNAVTNIDIVPTWIAGEDRFWFRHQQDGGHQFLMVAASTGHVEPAFDHLAVAAALGAAPTSLPIASFEQVEHGLIVQLTGGDRMLIDSATGHASSIGRPRPELVAPNGSALFLRNFNLWIRDAAGDERPLTTDGEAYHRWADLSDNHHSSRVEDFRGTVTRSPQGTFWAPSADWILTSQVDDRSVEPYPYLESVPQDGSVRPRVHHIRKRIVGEPGRSTISWSLISAHTGRRVLVDALPGGLEIRRFDAWWAPDSGRAYALATTPSLDHAAIVEIDVATGGVRVVHQERTETWWDFNTFSHEAPQVRYLPERGVFLWYSERSGWGHIWMIDIAEGGVPRQLTDGEWSVWDIARVTDDHIVLVAGGREEGRHPYQRNWYRVDLDGDAPNTGLRLLTPEPLDHARRGRAHYAADRGNPLVDEISPSGRYFVDSMSSINTPPVVVLRDTIDGSIISELAVADTTRLDALGWRAPEVFSARSADGNFDMWGVVITPRRFDEQATWPVVERVYGGNQTQVQPRSFAESLNGAFMYGMYSLAEMGFAVVLVDGPGTPYRSREFRQYDFRSADRLGLRHHRAAIEQLASEHGWMDTSRVGICGHSYGGYSTTMALLLQPDFYKVGHASSAALDLPLMQAEVIDWHHGLPDYGEGRRVKTPTDGWPEPHRAQSPSTYAEHLVGQLELVYGDLDDAAEPAATLAFIDALTRAGKRYSLVYLAGRDHHHTVEPYHQKRMWDWMIEHVQGRVPLWHYALPVEAGVRSATM